MNDAVGNINIIMFNIYAFFKKCIPRMYVCTMCIDNIHIFIMGTLLTQRSHYVFIICDLYAIYQMCTRSAGSSHISSPSLTSNAL